MLYDDHKTPNATVAERCPLHGNARPLLEAARNIFTELANDDLHTPTVQALGDNLIISTGPPHD